MFITNLAHTVINLFNFTVLTIPASHDLFVGNPHVVQGAGFRSMVIAGIVFCMGAWKIVATAHPFAIHV